MGALDLCLDIVEYKRKNYISVSASLKLFLELIKVINFSTEEHKIIWRCSKRTHASDIIIYIKKERKNERLKINFQIGDSYCAFNPLFFPTTPSHLPLSSHLPFFPPPLSSPPLLLPHALPSTLPAASPLSLILQVKFVLVS